METQEIFPTFFDGIHNILILLIIVIIIALQIKVFLNVKRRIFYYKNVVPNLDEFKTEKIYLTESEIAKLPLEKIYANLKNFKYRDKEIMLNDSNPDYEAQESGVLYYGAPISGEFISQESQSEAVYKLYNISDNTANFSLVNNAEKIPMYIFNHTFYIDSGCEVKNNYSSNNLIIELKPGVANYIEGNWKISQKSQIKFS